MIIMLCTAAIFADDQRDEYDDGYVYEQNGAGDQFIKIDLFGVFPLNFNGQLYPGAGVNLGYYRFVSSNLAVGGSAYIGYNVSIGNKPLITLPVTFDVLYEPYFGKFEFPLTLGVGFGVSTCQGLTYFPGLAVKATGGAYYRFTETWSAGINGSVYWLPQWLKDSSRNTDGFFATAGLGVRYHF